MEDMEELRRIHALINYGNFFCSTGYVYSSTFRTIVLALKSTAEKGK